MGNICSRGSNDPEAFSSPGRVVGTNPSNQSAAPRASVPAKANWKNTPGRTLGDSSTGETQGNSDEARSNAAIAAQKRAESASSANKGKLGSKLAAQKAKTQTQTLNEVSETERAARDQDDQKQMAAYQ
ncbi:uncharacterized protein N7469_001494 [Penicillium citrinum]|uniref:Uncharacterized protein n=2 Tax=Penicillium TaxID=5073 RepID=A0A9W9PEN4_PENCI|nr:uncharacterized protein N7469_001494 [Penicillium citrinum]KAJ5243167.1 hypothetical protein N7469_001494 [Penicillium citrinum]KAJ5599330.1 hypothetical protein N7450_000397 [Penicillium hetheringtonii]KAK5806237.1 hypothetical protein VI817_000495 [Penicillium citrinum]